MRSDPGNHPVLSYSDSAAEVLQFLKPAQQDENKLLFQRKVDSY